MKSIPMYLIIACSGANIAECAPLALDILPGGQFAVSYQLSTGPSTSANLQITGDLSADLEFTDGRISKFRFLGGNVAYSDTTSDLIISTFLGTVTKVRLLTRNVVSSATSLDSAGAIDADTGVIENTGHRLNQDRGTITSRYMVGNTVLQEEIRNLATQPDRNPLVGITTVTSSLLEDLIYKTRYRIHFTHSRDETRTEPAELVNGTVNIREVGSFSTSGEIWAPGQAFVDWALAERDQVPGSLTEICKITGQPLIILYAFDAPPGGWSPPVTIDAEGGRIGVDLPSGGLKAPVRLEFSASLEHGAWAPLTQDDATPSVFERGKSGTVTMNLPPGNNGFIRLSLAD